MRLSDGRLASTRCSLCTFVHGAPEHLQAGVGQIVVAHPGLPEDLAIEGARLLVKFRALMGSDGEPFCPAHVLHVARRFNNISTATDAVLRDKSPRQASNLLRAFRVGAGAAGSATAPQQWAVEECLRDCSEDLLNFQKHCAKVRKDFCSKVCKANAIESWNICGMPCKQQPHLTEVNHSCDLNGDYTQRLLEHAKFQSPIFALVHGSQIGQPRLTRGVHPDCQCLVPWHQRSAWEQQPWIKY